VIYDIRHVTTYSYAYLVNFARCSLRLQPRNLISQRVISHHVTIEPKPVARSVRVDFFGTLTESIVVEKPHHVLRIDSQSRVFVDRSIPHADEPGLPWEIVRDQILAARDLTATSPINYMFASPMVPIVDAVTAYAAHSFAPKQGIVTCAADLMTRIYREFKYDPSATVIATPLQEVLDNRHGVCQDFAHLMISGLRGLGLSAAYVSGYLRTYPPEGQPRLQGADATHAWVSVWCGEDLGWVGFDPTNNIIAANDHIVLAEARDFADVSPVDGIIVGSRQQKLTVGVDVIPVE
jgi:transglutaminase-like putative cysteine protease